MAAQRLAISPVLRTALRESLRAPLAALVSDRLFTSACFGPDHPLAERFHPVTVTTKDRVEKAWISVIGREEPPPRPRRPPADVGQPSPDVRRNHAGPSVSACLIRKRADSASGGSPSRGNQPTSRDSSSLTRASPPVARQRKVMSRY